MIPKEILAVNEKYKNKPLKSKGSQENSLRIEWELHAKLKTAQNCKTAQIL